MRAAARQCLIMKKDFIDKLNRGLLSSVLLLKNIIYHLGSEDFPRVKIGVGKKPRPDYDLAAWVLGRFPEEDQKAIDKACEDAVSAAACIIESGCAAAAQNFKTEVARNCAGNMTFRIVFRNAFDVPADRE